MIFGVCSKVFASLKCVDIFSNSEGFLQELLTKYKCAYFPDSPYVYPGNKFSKEIDVDKKEEYKVEVGEVS